MINYTINIDSEDIIQSHIHDMLIWWMKTKQPDETAKIEQYIREQLEPQEPN